MPARRIAAAAAAGAVLPPAVLWLSRLPAGVPGEWVWPRIAYDAGLLPGLILGLVVAGIVLAVYLLVAWLGERRMAGCGGAERGLWLAVLMVTGFAWLTAVQDAPATPWGATRTGWVLYYPGPSGYFTRAREMVSIREFLEGYSALMAEGDVLHTGTHPPGLFVMHRGLLNLCCELPWLSRVLIASEPESVREGFGAIESAALAGGRPLLECEQAALWLVALLTQAAAALTVLPLYLLLRVTWGPVTAWRATCFWPLLPAVAMFLPKSDVLYPLAGTIFLWLWWSGWQRRIPARMFAAGVAMAVGMLFSLALLPVACAGVLLVAGSLLQRGRGPLDDRASATDGKEIPGSRHCSAVWLAGAAGVGWLMPQLGLAIWPGLNVPDIWLSNLRNHAGFYDQFPRTWWKWLLYNPMELVLAGGLPVCVLAAGGAWQVLRERGKRLAAENLPAVACLTTWCLLWLSCRNMGEAARLWILLLPWLCWVAAPVVGEAERSGPVGAAHESRCVGTRLWLFVVACQAVCCAGTVTRLSGFHFGGF